jgi:ubiquinone/menaquinone biosynthesis C-methylase UbiE
MHSHSHGQPVQTEGRLIRWANTYDLFTNLFTLGQAVRFRRMTVDLAGIHPGDTLLDVGCGTGAVTLPAKEKLGTHGHAIGIDPSPEMVARARQNAARKGLEIDFRLGVIEELPFPDESIDVATSSLMMHHLPAALKSRGLAEVYRVLKPGGRLLIADLMRPNASLASRIFNHVSMHAGLTEGVEDLQPLLEQAGFNEITPLKERFLMIGFIRATK